MNHKNIVSSSNSFPEPGTRSWTLYAWSSAWGRCPTSIMCVCRMVLGALVSPGYVSFCYLLLFSFFFFSETVWLLPAISSTVYISHPKVPREGRFMLSPDFVEGIAWSQFTGGPHSLLIALVYRWHSFWKKSLVWDLLHVSKGFYLRGCLTCVYWDGFFEAPNYPALELPGFHCSGWCNDLIQLSVSYQNF